jgi:hypothetical protein
MERTGTRWSRISTTWTSEGVLLTAHVHIQQASLAYGIGFGLPGGSGVGTMDMAGV